MKLKLSPKNIANLELAPDQDEQFYWDTDLSGYALRLRKGGHRTFVTQYRHHGRTRRMIIGDAKKVTEAAARKAAQKVLAKVELGGDPQGDKQEARQAAVHTLRSVAEDYLAAKAPGLRPTSLRLSRLYLIGAYFKPLHTTAITAITHRDVASRITAIKRTSGEVTARQARAHLSACFRWAMGEGLTSNNPVASTNSPAASQARDRVLDGKELAMIWHALDGVQDDYAAIVKLLILTGCRREEIGAAHWSEFSPDMTSWTLPATRSKNRKAHTLPLTPLMREIIKSVPMREGKDHLFGRKGFTDWSNCKKALDERLNLEPWTHHDIRRSAATGMADIGIAPHIVEEILNHRSGHRRGPAGIYNRSVYTNEVAAALARWSEHVLALVEGRESNVVPMRA